MYSPSACATRQIRGPTQKASSNDPIPAEQYGWTEHSARRVSQTLRPHLREVLLEMGFELK